jgi:hypothetical protein
LMLPVGEVLVSLLKKVAVAVQTVIKGLRWVDEKLGGMLGQLVTMVVIVGTIAVPFAAVVGLIGAVARGIGAVTVAVGALRAASWLLVLPFSKIGLMIAGISAAGWGIYELVSSLSEAGEAENMTPLPGGDRGKKQPSKKMARGGLIMPQPGGTAVTVAEAGQPEIIANPKLLRQVFGTDELIDAVYAVGKMVVEAMPKTADPVQQPLPALARQSTVYNTPGYGQR